jgi:hypothetical protein
VRGHGAQQEPYSRHHTPDRSDCGPSTRGVSCALRQQEYGQQHTAGPRPSASVACQRTIAKVGCSWPSTPHNPPGAIVVDRRAYEDSVLVLQAATDRNADFCSPFVHALGVNAAAVSTLGAPLGLETVCASNEQAARLNEIQLDLGEGPCWEALASRRPVLEPDVQRSERTTWPLARQALHGTGLGAVFAFPLVVAGIDVGAVDLYSWTPHDLSAQQIDDATSLSRILARQVLRRALVALTASGEEAGPWDGQYSRREVHQATGMIMAQMDVPASDALLVLRGHAFASNRSVRDLSIDVVERRLDFTPTPD